VKDEKKSIVEKMAGKPSMFSKKESEETEVEESDEDDDGGYVEAMKAFEEAGTTEEKAEALKAFIKLCS
jgi:hypothetical protein